MDCTFKPLQILYIYSINILTFHAAIVVSGIWIKAKNKFL